MKGSYSKAEVRHMAHRAKIFKIGGSQAVRLPRNYRFQDAEEVLISRQGRRVILEPIARSWSRRFLALAGSAQDFPYPEDPTAFGERQSP
jgi:virulence-associated protein VagC